MVPHTPDDIVLICGDDLDRCQTAHVSREDIAFYAFNLAKFGDSVAQTFELKGSSDTTPSRYTTLCIGSYRPLAGFDFHCYLTLQPEPDPLLRVVQNLCTSSPRPFLLLVPTDTLCNARCCELLDNRGALLISLEGCLQFDAPGQLSTAPGVATILAKFNKRLLPSTDERTTIEFFPTPADADWGDVHIHFVDGHRVFIRVKNESGTLNYTQMGMHNRKNGEPTVQWQLLEMFANNYGHITWDSRGANRKLKMQKYLLAENLQRFFRIDGDPIRFKSRSRGWESRFHILPEGDDDLFGKILPKELLK